MMSSSVSGSVSKTAAQSTQLFVKVKDSIYPNERLPPPPILRQNFGPHGTIKALVSAKAGAIAFITFLTPQEALTAKNAMNGFQIVTYAMGRDFERTLFVDFARGKPQKEWNEAREVPASSAADFTRTLVSPSSLPPAPVQATASAPSSASPKYC